MANRQTKVLGGSLTQSQSFTLDPGLFQYIQSVLVEVDNTAGPDVNPTLTVATVNGTPIADKTQGTAIPAGDTGRATWALRLTDETSGGGGAGGPYADYFDSVAPTIPLSSGQFTWGFGDGTPLLDLTVPKQPTVLADGTYAFMVRYALQALRTVNVVGFGILDVYPTGPAGPFSLGDYRFCPAVGGTGYVAQSTLTAVREMTAGDKVVASWQIQPAANGRQADMQAYVQQIG